MADADVKINISTDVDTGRIEQLKAELASLKKEAAAMEKQAARIPDLEKAQRTLPTRSTARELDAARAAKGGLAAQYDVIGQTQREISALQKEPARLERDREKTARERSAAEKAVTREMREQQALRRAGITQAVGTVQAGAQIAGGGGGMGMIGGLAALANPVAIGAAIIGGATLGIAKLMASEKQKDTLMDLGVKRDSFNRSYQLNRAAGIFGSSGELVSSALAGDEEISKRKADRSLLDEKARVKWHDPSSWTWGGLRKNSAQREAEENESQIADLEKQKEKAIAAAQRKFMEEEGGMRLRALRARSKRTLAGSREAFLEEIGQEWMNTYKEALKASGSESVAKEMADLTVGNKVRDMQASAGAGLVDSKSGGAEMAAAAQWAMRVFPDVGAKIESLHATVQAQANQIEDQSKK